MPCSYTRPRDSDAKSPPQSIGLASAKSLSLKKAGPYKGEMQASLKESGHKIAEGPTPLRRGREIHRAKTTRWRRVRRLRRPMRSRERRRKKKPASFAPNDNLGRSFMGFADFDVVVVEQMNSGLGLQDS